MTKLPKIALAMALSVALAACSGGGDDGKSSGTDGETIAKVKAPDGQSWEETVTKKEDGTRVLGNPDAPITLVEYGSFTCSHCVDFAAKEFGKLRDQFISTGQVKFELHNFVRDPLDLTTAILVNCGADESYYALAEQAFGNFDNLVQTSQSLSPQKSQAIDALPENQKFVGLAQELGLFDFFAQRGISRDQAVQCLTDPERASKLVDATTKAANELNIQGTPAFFVNGEQVDFTGWESLEQKLQQMGAR